jgi:phosphopantothenoylcysteine decarboxylase / phosphopantothenate---cysteine ligase
VTRLVGKNIVLGVTGGIAAYKAAELCRLLVKEGADVHVVMTEAAQAFIGPLTMQTLSGHRVGTRLVDASDEAEVGHIRLADRADLIVVAPATADSLARFSGGRADDLLGAVILASHADVLLAPAMNVNMWENPITQENLQRLLANPRFSTVGPDAGPLACGWIGAGRLVEPDVVVEAIVARLATRGPLSGKRVLVSAGPTQEPVDAVRFLGNRSSGKMGFALASAAVAMGAEVVLVAGPVDLPTPPGVSTRIDVQTALQMQAAIESSVEVGIDVVVMAAAVADFRPAVASNAKLSRRDGEAPSLALVANPDILSGLGKRTGDRRPRLIGFAAEVLSGEALVARAQQKLLEKGCDAIVANSVGQGDTGFGSDDNQGFLVTQSGSPLLLPREPKIDMARRIWRHVAPLLFG